MQNVVVSTSKKTHLFAIHGNNSSDRPFHIPKKSGNSTHFDQQVSRRFRMWENHMTEKPIAKIEVETQLKAELKAIGGYDRDQME